MTAELVFTMFVAEPFAGLSDSLLQAASAAIPNMQQIFKKLLPSCFFTVDLRLLFACLKIKRQPTGCLHS
jgi:hypothetical protein